MEFTTATGKLSIEETIIRQSRILERCWEKQLIKLAAPILILFSSFNRFVLPNFEHWKTGKKVLAIIFWSFMLLAILLPIYELLFLKHWGKKLSIAAIDKINITSGRNELETKIEVTLKSKRIKSYHFRNLENQHTSFIEAICAFNPDIKIFEKGKEVTASLN